MDSVSTGSVGSMELGSSTNHFLKNFITNLSCIFGKSKRDWSQSLENHDGVPESSKSDAIVTQGSKIPL